MSVKPCEYPPCDRAAGTTVRIGVGDDRIVAFALCVEHALRVAALVARKGGRVEDRRSPGRRP